MNSPSTKRSLGRTGIQVFPIGLGEMPLSIQGRPDEAQAIAVIHAALDAGVDFIDTADSYCQDETDKGHGERLVHKALKLRGGAPHVTVATKGGLLRHGGSWSVDASPRHLREACEKSLKALGTDAITLYQLHAPDDRVPYADSMGEIARLKKEGKIVHVGISNVSLEEYQLAQSIVRIESVQNRCNPQESEDYTSGFVKVLEKDGVTFLPHSPVGGHHGHVALAKSPLLAKISQAHDVSPYQVLLAWHLAQGALVVPIPGASKITSIVDSAKAARLHLTASELAQISGK